MVKPDGVQRGLIGEVIARIERKGLQVVGMKLLTVTPELAALHYAEHEGKVFYPKLIEYITAGPVVALVVEGHRAVGVLRSLVGKTDPAEAQTGTIRGDFGLCKGRNLVHAADSIDAAKREIALYFAADDLVTYDQALLAWVHRDD
jgi:nucleoside-diphosphate kinase